MVLGAHDRLPNLWPGPVSHTHLVINNILNLHGSSLGARRLEPPPPSMPGRQTRFAVTFGRVLRRS